jgi:hypothetical protein
MAIAIVVSSVVLFNVGNFVEEDRCLDGGGRLRRAGADHICEAADGSYIRVRVLPVSPWGWLLVLGSWIGIAAAVYLPLARFFPAAPPRTANPPRSDAGAGEGSRDRS